MVTDKKGNIFDDRRKANIPVDIDKRVKNKTEKEKSQIKRKIK